MNLVRAVTKLSYVRDDNHDALWPERLLTRRTSHLHRQRNMEPISFGPLSDLIKALIEFISSDN